jgi:hypothetical protein
MQGLSEVRDTVQQLTPGPCRSWFNIDWYISGRTGRWDSGRPPPRLCQRTHGMLRIGWFPERNVGLHSSDALREILVRRWSVVIQ